jgi:mannose-6-phosphate isomerase-like protein (cupin superfamily)
MDLRAGAGDRRVLLGGPPQTAGMRAGVVSLRPGASVGRHSTGAREEFIVVLEGRGEVRVGAAAPLAVSAGTGAYVPPERDHDVVNSGDAPLRYVYVVAPARDPEAQR